MPAALKIRIGASVDRSVEAAFSAFEARSKRAGMVVARNLNQGFKGGGAGANGGTYQRVSAGYDAQAKAAERAAAREARAAQQAARVREREERRVAKIVEQCERDRIRSLIDINRRADQERQRESRAAERAATQQSRAQMRAQERFARRTSYRATRFLFPPPSGILGSARSFGSDMLRGAGIDFNIGGMVGRNVALSRAATALSNQAFQPGAQGPNGQRVSEGTLVGEARDFGKTYGIDPAEILKAHEAFVNLTGDLQTSRGAMKDMVQLSAATGTNIEEMAAAQAEVAKALPDTADKSAKVAALMRVIAGQGKVGAVEIKQLATGMAGLAAKAPMFAGDVGTNIQKLGALAQLARGTGGAKSAREAVTGVERFADTFANPARVKEFKKAGISVYDANGKVRDPFELIKESLVATGGDPMKMSKLFQSVMGKRGVTALTTAYTGAGGGAKGLAAVQAQFDKYTKGSALDPRFVKEAAARSAETDAAKAQRFQNRLDEIAQKLQSNLLPALEQLAPRALQIADAFAKVIEWATKNPGEAITAAIVGSILRAGLESAARGALEKLILRLAGQGGGAPIPGGGAVPGAGGGGLGAVAGGLAGVGLLAAGIGYGANSARDKLGMKRSVATLMPGFDEKGNFSMTDMLLDSIPGYGQYRTMKRAKAFGTELGTMAAGKPETLMQKGGFAPAQFDPGSIGRSVADGIAGRTLNVRVTNAEDIKSPPGAKVDQGGRSPAPGSK